MSISEDAARPTSPGPAGSTRRRGRVALVVIAGLVLAAIAGLVPRIALRDALDRRARAVRDTPPTVQTTKPRSAPSVVDVPLPATTQPVLVTGIWARTDGYLRTRYVDIGDRVTAGQLLAEIAAPEVDQQLRQARATLTEAQANVVKLQADLDLARTTLKRYVAAGAATVSQQQIDVRTSSVTVAEKAVDAARATVNANQANVDRLVELQGFERVYAPFDGIITQRNVDFGSLITSGSTQGTTELFNLAQTDPLRVFVFVPQAYASDVRVGAAADVKQRELPDRVFHGEVTRTAGALDATTRTLLTEVQVPNPDGALLPGAYVTVHFQIARAKPPLLIPATALLADAQGTRVAVIAGGALHYRAIELGRDNGATVEVLSGLAADETIAERWPGAIADGAPVTVATADASGGS